MPRLPPEKLAAIVASGRKQEAMGVPFFLHEQGFLDLADALDAEKAKRTRILMEVLPNLADAFKVPLDLGNSADLRERCLAAAQAIADQYSAMRLRNAELEATASTLTLACDHASDALDAEKRESQLLRGAMNAQDGREREAGKRCGILHEEHGCDWPDAVADAVVSLRAALDAERKAHAATCKARDELNAAHLYAIAGEKSAHEDYDKKCEELEAERKARREAEEDAERILRFHSLQIEDAEYLTAEDAAAFTRVWKRTFAMDSAWICKLARAAGEGKAEQNPEQRDPRACPTCGSLSTFNGACMKCHEDYAMGGG